MELWIVLVSFAFGALITYLVMAGEMHSQYLEGVAMGIHASMHSLGYCAFAAVFGDRVVEHMDCEHAQRMAEDLLERGGLEP